MASKGVWLQRVRDLMILASRSDGMKVVAAATKWSFSCRESLVVLEQHSLQQSISWGGAARASCETNGRFFRSSARQYKLVAPWSSISASKLSWDYSDRLKSVPFSTVPGTEQSVTENFSTETAPSTVTVVEEAEASVIKFAPEIEITPTTPLVQAIQSQESSFATESTGSGHEAISDSDVSRAKSPELSKTDSGREVHPGRVYVGGLPFALKGEELREELRELCSKFGTVMDVNLGQHLHQSARAIEAGKHRGFAFVTMETQDQAQEVIDNLNATLAWGRILTVSYGLKRIQPPSDPRYSTKKSAIRCKVFIGNLHEGTSRMDLMDRFKRYGVVVEVKLITELHSGRSRGFGFVTFAEEGQAMRAVLDSDGSILDGSVIRVNIAKYPQGY